VRLTFSEELNPIDARSPVAYELRNAGPDNDFDTADDVLFIVKPQYTPGQSTVILGLDNGNYVTSFRIIINQAPFSSGSNALQAIDEDLLVASNPGTLVSSLLTSQVIDADGPALGLAVTAVDNSNGIWEYATDGTNYSAVASQLLGGKVLLLASDSNSRVGFLPALNFNGIVVGLSYRAWEQSDETLEGTAVIPSQLFTSSLSSTTVIASILVNPGNDPPTLARNFASVTVNVLDTFTNAGTWNDIDGDMVTLSATVGDVVKNLDGTWSWSYQPTTRLVNQLITITANDGLVDTTVTFSITANSIVKNRQLFYNRSTSSAFGDGSGNPITAIDFTKSVTPSAMLIKAISERQRLFAPIRPILSLSGTICRTR